MKSSSHHHISSFVISSNCKLWGEVRSTFIGLMASVLWAMENGVFPVVVWLIVRIAHNTCGSSSTHAPFDTSNFFFKIRLMVLLMASTWPFAYVWWEEDKCFLIPNSSHRSLIFLLLNCLLLSDTSEWEIPKWQMIFFQRNLDVLASIILARGSISTHLVK